MRTLPLESEMFQALLARDESYEGLFVVGVRTTGIYCRATCPARKPRRENVEFFAAPADAERAGYRPCRRCRPLEPAGQHPPWARELIELVERGPLEQLSDADLARRGVEPERARRYFQRRFGMTFQAYQRRSRLGRALERLAEGAEIEGLALDTGFASSSGFREAFERLFGAAPSRARQARASAAALVPSPLGPLVACAGREGVTLLEFADRRGLAGQVDALRRATGAALVPGRNEHLEELEGELDEYFAGRRRAFDVPVHLAGTEFQRAVWQELLAIPCGETRSYEQVAAAVGRPGAQRAVGRANGQNRIAILIPCHRVVHKDGSLCGYGGGLWRKRALLELERGAVDG
jgi:AraC family transcriptional regulator of adaptative response/methylated-DNA-[protein]-cysteine methyltransferase